MSASNKKNPKNDVQINVNQDVGRVESGQVTGVHLESVQGNLTIGLTAADVQRLVNQFQSKPFTGRCPYIGLEPFQKEDFARFFGRERLIVDLIKRLEHSTFIMVAGASGSGKSSLVRAGLMPRLESGVLKGGSFGGTENWLYQTIQPGRNPFAALGRLVAGLTGTLASEDDILKHGIHDPDRLQRWIRIALGEHPERKLLLFVDQFEEIFTLIPDADEATRVAYLAMLTQAASSEDHRTIVLTAMRSDFVASCSHYPILNELLNNQFMQVGAMTPDELVQAVARPAVEAGLKIDPELVRQVIFDMGSEPGVLPLMQFALRDLFDYLVGQGGVQALTLEGYLQRGGLHKVLERHADRVLATLSPAEREIAASIFSGLVVPGKGRQDTARTARFDELVPEGVPADQAISVISKIGGCPPADHRRRIIGPCQQRSPGARTLAGSLVLAAPAGRRKQGSDRSSE